MWERPWRGDCRDTKVPPTFRWNRVSSAAAPRIATADATKAEPRPAQNSMRLQRLEKINRAGRFKTATAARSLQKMEHRRENDLVTANKNARQKQHQGARIEARSARRNHSSFSCWWVAFAAYGRATTTIQLPGRSRPCWDRTI